MSRFLVFLLLIGLIAGCSTPPSCEDPLGCVFLEPDQPLKIGIVAPLAGENLCPPTRETIAALRSALPEEREVLDHPVDLVLTNSQNLEEIAAQMTNDLAQDPTMVAIFLLDCSNQNARIAKIGADAGLPVYINRLPEGYISFNHLFAWSPQPLTQASKIAPALLELGKGDLTVIGMPLDPSIELIRQVCKQWKEQTRAECYEMIVPGGLGELTAIELEPAAQSVPLILLIGPTEQVPTAEVQHWINSGQRVVLYDPFQQPVSTFYGDAEGLYWIGNPALAGAGPNDETKISTGSIESASALLSIEVLLQAVESSSTQQGSWTIIPRAALLETIGETQVEKPPLSWSCGTDPVCVKYEQNLYQVGAGNRIINP